MISVIRLWNTVNQLAKNGTSGYQNQYEFNRDLADTQESLMSFLAPLYSVNQSLKDLLSPFATYQNITTDSDGVLTKPMDYYRVSTASVNGYPAYPISVNEKDVIRTSAIRTPSSTTNLYFYYQENEEIMFLPEEELDVRFSYLRKPGEASIILTESSDADRDYLIPTVGYDLEWDDNAFNFFLYMMLEKLGLEMKEQLSMEFANIGLSKEISKI